jgi:hypothetical protein
METGATAWRLSGRLFRAQDYAGLTLAQALEKAAR